MLDIFLEFKKHESSKVLQIFHGCGLINIAFFIALLEKSNEFNFNIICCQAFIFLISCSSLLIAYFYLYLADNYIFILHYSDPENKINLQNLSSETNFLQKTCLGSILIAYLSLLLGIFAMFNPIIQNIISSVTKTSYFSCAILLIQIIILIVIMIFAGIGIYYFKKQSLASKN